MTTSATGPGQFTTLADLERMLATAQAEGEFVNSADDLPSALVAQLVSDAYIEINDRLEVLCDEYQANTVANQMDYGLPNNFQAFKRTRHPVTVYSTDTAKSQPDGMTWDQAREVYGDFRNPTSQVGVKYFVYDRTIQANDGQDAGRIKLIWPPQNSITNGLLIDYLVHPGYLDTVIFGNSDANARTADFTNGDKTVTLSGSLSKTIKANQAIGLRSTTSAGVLPTKWYRIQSVTSQTEVELSVAYEETTAEGAEFVLSDVSMLELRHPGKWRHAVIAYTKWKWTEMQDSSNQMVLLKAENDFYRAVDEAYKFLDPMRGMQRVAPDAYKTWPSIRVGRDG